MQIIKSENVCCEMMLKQLNWSCVEHKSKYACPDVIISYSEIFDEYGIIIHDGGNSSVLISYCPWCGKNLPESKRDLWFDELEKLGFTDPLFDDSIPQKYNSSQWYEEK